MSWCRNLTPGAQATLAAFSPGFLAFLHSKIVTSASLFALGDVIAQKLDGTAKTKGYQADRILRGAFW
jgi:hypothetical protein